MKIRLLIKGCAIQIGEKDYYNPCKTVDVEIPDNVIDEKHEYIIGAEILKQEQDQEYKRKGEGTREATEQEENIGYWIKYDTGWVACSRCKTSFPKTERFVFVNYCPYCGEKMVES